MLKAKHLKDK